MASRLDQLRLQLRSNPKDQVLLLEFATQALREKELEYAVDGFQHLLKLNPRKDEAWLGLAESLHALGRSSEAAVRLENYLQNRPESSRAHLLLARICLAEGEREDAHRHWQRAQQLDASLRDEDLQAAFGLGSTTRGKRERRANSSAEGETAWNMEAEQEAMHEEDDQFEEGFQLEDFAPAQVNLKEVQGLERESQSLQALLKAPSRELKQLLGRQSRGGALLYGPPGCGKTLLAEAVAGTTEVPFLSVGLHQLLDSYIGNAEKNLHDLFALAASHSPCVLFFDKIESFCSSQQSQSRFTPTKTLLTQLLMELDQLDAENQVLVIGATSKPWELEPALLRAGRLSNLHFITPPTEQLRAQVIEQALAKIWPSNQGADEATKRQLLAQKLSERTAELSIAEIRAQLASFVDEFNRSKSAMSAPEASEYERLSTSFESLPSAVKRWKLEAKREFDESSSLSFPPLLQWLDSQAQGGSSP